MGTLFRKAVKRLHFLRNGRRCYHRRNHVVHRKRLTDSLTRENTPATFNSQPKYGQHVKLIHKTWTVNAMYRKLILNRSSANKWIELSRLHGRNRSTGTSPSTCIKSAVKC